MWVLHSTQSLSGPDMDRRVSSHKYTYNREGGGTAATVQWAASVTVACDSRQLL